MKKLPAPQTVVFRRRRRTRFSTTTRRPATEREIWQRVQKKGKTAFVLRSTLTLGGLGFLAAALAERFAILRHPLGWQLLIKTATLSALASLFAAFYLWHRGEAMLNRPTL